MIGGVDLETLCRHVSAAARPGAFGEGGNLQDFQIVVADIFIEKFLTGLGKEDEL